MDQPDYDADVAEHPSPVIRIVFLVLGSVCVLLGIIGIFLPVMPTTVFLLLAAACYARGSRRFYDKLLANRTFGPLILEWRRYRSMPRRAKWTAIAATAAGFAVSILFFLEDWRLRTGMALFGLVLCIYLYRIPSRARTPRPQ